jgi:RimJ/RimL family protein N-acetyltransferase
MAVPTAAALPVLETPRLRLRPYRPTDAAAMFALYSDPRVMRYWSFPPWREPAQAAAYLERVLAETGAGQVLAWAVARREDDLLVGTATLHSWHREQGRAEIGYSLSPAHQGRGLASEALRAALGHAFGALGLRRVEADVDPRNRASCRLLERLGFRQEGLLRARWEVAGEVCDSAFFGLLADEFVAAPPAPEPTAAEAAS